MILETSNATSAFSKKPHVKKGYYPGKLTKVELFTDKEGNARVGKFGQQLIFDFEVWKADDNDVPLEPLKDGEGKNIVISKFSYHKYKNTAKDGSWKEGDYRTAITPNSAITKILESLGWKFSTEPVDPESFINNFVELNIDDFKYGEGSDAYTASTIKDIGKITTPDEKKEITPEVQAKIEELESKKKKLKELLDSEGVSKDGYNQGIESIDAEIRKLK